MAGSGGTPAVFVSYASQDSDAAGALCEALRAAGIEVWFDQSELRGGDAWDQAIRKQIKACSLFIPIISQNTRSRDEGYFRLEWKLAVDRSHLMAGDKTYLLPVVVDDTPDDDARVPDRFREFQWIRLAGGRTSGAFVDRVTRLLSPVTAAVRYGAQTRFRRGAYSADQAVSRGMGQRNRQRSCNPKRARCGLQVAGQGVRAEG
jgi:TIR domain